MQKNFKKLLKYDLVVQRRMLALELIEIFRLFFIFIFFFGRGSCRGSKFLFIELNKILKNLTLNILYM